MYKPNPKDTSAVKLTDDLTVLLDQLAENTHDVWAQQRIAEGWSYGPSRSDRQKEHPNLVPYQQLAESEKEYDRKTALETIKVLRALGYTIAVAKDELVQPSPASVRGEHELTRIREFLDAPTRHRLAELVACWDARDRELWASSVENFRLLADHLARMGEPLLTYDVADEGLKHFPRDIRLRQLLALALARSGATDSARVVLEKLSLEGSEDEETIGLLARTHKDAADTSTDSTHRQDHLRRAHQLYTKAYEQSGGYWSGINAATTAALLGETGHAAKLAREVREACHGELRRLERSNGDRYWPLATLGEASLILGEWSAAEHFYSSSGEVAGKRYGDIHSSRRNARLLLDNSAGERDRIERCFQIPAAVVFAGHMVDQPGRRFRRFPPELEVSVRDAIRKRLKKLNAGFGFSSAACGSDILFLETLLELGGDAHVVLPYEKQEFIRDSVDIIPGANWEARCEEVLKRVASVNVTSSYKFASGTVEYEYVNRLLHGMALVSAHQLDTAMVPVAVWDGRPGDGPSGTASSIEHWKKSNLPVEIIAIDEILKCHSSGLKAQVSNQPRDRHAAAPATSEFCAEICGLLFADAVGFSKLNDQEVQLFVRHFLGLVADVTAKSTHPPIVKNTWGDGLYFVFRSARDAGVLALDLCQRICSTDWHAKGLCNLSLRISLHAGPVYSCLDPITQRQNYMGAHVSRAARIEPITPPGQVYASHAFAALAAVERVREFACDYVGRVMLAKNYGTFPTYVLRRSVRT
ncbi:MAG TPA: TRAFs-binding domain-containing protein [Candidatus Dormibacteraeota bacterium]|nr:TRAFs-binding domain-containing protein [Candidatus Dormibacteraeota bacterium]